MKAKKVIAFSYVCSNGSRNVRIKRYGSRYAEQFERFTKA